MTSTYSGAETDATVKKAGPDETGCSDEQRFLLELEFVQCLANPQYINWLAQTQQLDDPSLVQYLEYLQYWRRPQYAKYIIYPHALFFLDMLQSQDFRTAMARAPVKDMVHTQQLYFWQHFRANRLKGNTAPSEAVPNISSGEMEAQSSGRILGSNNEGQGS